jgi:hypothetical protein
MVSNAYQWRSPWWQEFTGEIAVKTPGDHILYLLLLLFGFYSEKSMRVILTNVSGKELEPRATDVYLDPDYNDKFQSADLDFLGIGPPSPKFYSRRVPSTPKVPQHPQQQPLLNPEPG